MASRARHTHGVCKVAIPCTKLSRRANTTGSMHTVTLTLFTRSLGVHETLRCLLAALQAGRRVLV